MNVPLNIVPSLLCMLDIIMQYKKILFFIIKFPPYSITVSMNESGDNMNLIIDGSVWFG